MEKKTPALSLEVSSKVGNSLNLIKALGDSLVCIGIAKNQASLLDGTLQNLGLLIIDQVNELGSSLGVI